jgi:hypothetical protein
MGCKQSKAVEAAAHPTDETFSKVASKTSSVSRRSPRNKSRESIESVMEEDSIYRMLLKVHTNPDDYDNLTNLVLDNITPFLAAYQNPTTKSTPLHMAVRLLDVRKTGGSNGLPELLLALMEAYPKAIYAKDASGNTPLHYAIAPQKQDVGLPASAWAQRTAVLKLLLRADRTSASSEYLHKNNILYTATSEDDGCSALYRALQTIPDDFDFHSSTVGFIHTLVDACGSAMVGVGNASDGDKPLALLYRRFTRQFDLAEKFFSGDNSRPQVVEHRRRYKTAAANTYKIIETLLRVPPVEYDEEEEDRVFRTVHRAVQVETPPDLLRYIVETNAEDLAVEDEEGKLPLHYAAMSKPAETIDHKVAFPAFYCKYVIDELLYKYPEAAAKPDADGNFPLVLAVRAGKQWIGGGIKSLHEAFPEAVKQIDLESHGTLKEALSMDLESQQEDGTPKEEKVMEFGVVIRDEHHDAIMLVQSAGVGVSEVVTSLWAHEEDPGVQMLGCVALARMVSACKSEEEILRISLTAVPAVVNAMKAHPNEVIVQEKGCHALKGMAGSDGKREVSFVASGAVAAIVGAMQAHVSDPGVQEEACGAISRIIKFGGDDRATIVASVSGLTALVNAIAAHPHVVGVQSAGCAALRELTEFQESANLPDLPRSHVEPLLEVARSRYPAECGESVKVLMTRLA